jgi:hypothetical protein
MTVPDATLKHLRELRRRLLHLHKTLLEMERADFERFFGRVTSGELLQLVINHAQFAWLRLISRWWYRSMKCLVRRSLRH